MPFTHAYTGSNPVRVTIKNKSGGLAQLGEHLPYKQRVGGSSPSSSTIKVLLAQLVEHLTFNQRVRGSSPLQDTIFLTEKEYIKHR